MHQACPVELRKPGVGESAPHDTPVVTNTNGRTVRRAGLGPWEDTGVNVTAVYAVRGIDPSVGHFIRVP